METDNETINDIVREMRDDAVAADAWCETHGEMASAAPVLNRHADRILAAHKREIAAKDEEMLNLRKSLARVMEVTGDCRKCEECGDETCPWFGEPDGCNNREGRELFLAGKLVDPLKAKDTEIAELHNMIEELADALHPFREWFGNQKLIDRAKEVIGLKEKGDMT